MKRFTSLLALAILLCAQSALATWYPIALTVPQYENGAGVPYSGAVLKAYQAGTSTVTPLATSSTGLTTANSIALNANGFPVLSGTTIIPHIDRTYKLSLYPTQTAADANTGAIWTVDNISPTTVTFDDETFTGTTTLEDLVVIGDSTFGDIIVVDSINDVNNNAVLEIGTTSSPVNHFKVTPSATGVTPTFSALGSDTNISINFLTKGTGTYNLQGTASVSAELKLFEDTDNGTNYISIASPSAVTTSKKWFLPEADTANGYWKSDGSGNISVATISLPVANQSASAWVVFNGTGTPAIIDGYNVTSIGDIATGRWTINFTTPFATANYACSVTPAEASTSVSGYAGTNGTPSASAIDVYTSHDDGGAYDSARVSVICFGDQ